MRYRAIENLALGVSVQLGLGHYAGWNRGPILSNDPGASASLPFAGVEGVISYRVVGVSPALLLNFRFAYRNDLVRETVRYSYVEDNWFSGEQSEVSAEQRVGAALLTFQVGAGVVF